MEGWLYGPLWALPLGLVLYLLYRSGFLAAKRIAAVLFVFRSGRDGDRVFLDACTGWVRHRVRLRESRTCEFVLDARLHPMEASVWKKANGISSAGSSTGPPEPAPCAGEVCSAPPETDPGSEPPSAKMREWDAPSHGSPVGASAAATPFCFHRPEK